MSVQTQEGWHTVEDGTKLYTKTWKQSSTPKARLLFVHGFSDHSRIDNSPGNNYDYFFNYLAERGIEVYAFDQRGWGRSVTTKSDRGRTGPTKTVLADISSMLQTLLPSPIPVFLMGHSMGGAETLVYATQGPPSLVSKIRGRLLPNHQLVNRLDSRWLTHDGAENKAWEEDELCHDTGTLEGLAGMLDRAEELDKGRVMVPEGRGEGGVTRLLVIHGTDDRINDFEASQRYVQTCKVGDKKLVSMRDMYHNMHAELGDDKTKYAENVAQWISDRLDLESSQAKL
ncbi:Alpha/Beta hydrolase protein [Delphinella strobiligena]|nr:Alpha/Beta hydrolase protein [Delphinella strobiligena]